MGYYVRITKSTTVIPNEHRNEVVKLWKLLNHPKFDERKRGGSYQGGKKAKAWYSWMTEDYDQTCNTVEDVLDMLGFEHELSQDGSVQVTEYDNKTGQEDIFFNTVAHLITGEMYWIGEDDDRYKWNFDAITAPLYDPIMADVLEEQKLLSTDKQELLSAL
jgi:hypothetical protein